MTARTAPGALAILALTTLTPTHAQTPPLLAQQPTLSATEIVFVFAGDLWSVPRAGRRGQRLTTGAGVESNPSFSPDGKSIAFTGQYDGNIDVFVDAVRGRRAEAPHLHPDADVALGWTPDGKKVLFSSARTSYSRFRELFSARLDGGLEESCRCRWARGGLLARRRALAYVPLPRAFTAWKRYRGGQTTPIWIAALSDSRDREGPARELQRLLPDVGRTTRCTSSATATARSRCTPTTRRRSRSRRRSATRAWTSSPRPPAPAAIVIEQFGQLQLFDLQAGRLTPVKITLAGDIAELRPKYVNVSRRLTNAHISPTGARALFEARGEILTVPAEKGDTRNLTATPGVMERDPAWSPDGKWIAYFSDESGEYELHVRDSMGRNEPREDSARATTRRST